MEKNQLSSDKQPDFLLTINFPPHVKNPQRIFSTASECIGALQACDRMLLKSFPTEIHPRFCFRAGRDRFFKNVVEAVSGSRG